MATQRLYSRSFAGGEVSKEMWGRIDDGKYQTGLAECVNFMARPQGAVENRPGTTFVAFAKYNDRKARLIPFIFSIDQTMVIELGHHYIRFHTMGQTLMDGPVPYEIAAPWSEAMLMDVHYVQSADVVTLVHPGAPPHELRRLGALDWQLMPIDFAPPPATVSATADATVATGMPPTLKYRYAVTWVRDSDGAESLPAELPEIDNNLFVTGNKNTIEVMAATPGAREYIVYKSQGGAYGFIGRIVGISDPAMVDDNIAPDMSRVPPRYDATLASDWPAAVGYYEQRKVFAGAALKPQNVWMTRPGTENAMTYSVPVRDDDRIAFRVAAQQVNAIRHIVPLSSLLLLTSSTEWRVTSVNSDAITPTSVSVKPQSYVGANNVQPVIVNNSVVFAAARGGHVHELGYNWQAQGYVTGDLSLRNADAFDVASIVDMAYVKAPYPVVWAVSSTGKLMGLTYVPEQQIGAWHTHETQGGAFESVAVVSELALVDTPYLVVQRTLGGVTRRCIERMNWRVVGNEAVDQADAYFVDCGSSRNYDPPVSEVTGIDHLNGHEVSILADGAVLPAQQVADGKATLPRPATTVHVGLPIDARIRTLPVVSPAGDPAFGQGRVKNVNKLWLRVHRSSGIHAGPSLGALQEFKQRTVEPYGAPPALVSGEIEIPLEPDWVQGGGQLYVRQTDPLPLTILALTAEVVFGG